MLSLPHRFPLCRVGQFGYTSTPIRGQRGQTARGFGKMAKLEMIKDGHLGGYIRGGDPGTWCPHLWSWVVEQFGIKSVLDVGCGEGHSTRFFRDLGCDVLG